MNYRRLFAVLILLCSCVIDLYGQQDSSAMHLSVDDVVITARRSIVSVPDTRGNVSINIEALQGIPRLGGAVDVIRLLQYTPGVAITQEGNTSLYVRGGDAGQSIMLLNGAPLYSPSHLLGFFSVLNTPHLSGLTLYKSGIPARYGSSTSSITELRTHSYIPKRIGAELNLGIIESDIALKLPIGKRGALFATARRSYASWLLQKLVRGTAIKYDFGDYGVGGVVDLGRVGRLSFNTHFNKDRAKADVYVYNSKCDLQWWNALGTVSLDTAIGDNVELCNTLYASIYDNTMQPYIASQYFGISAGVDDVGFRSNAKIDLHSVQFEVGADCMWRGVTPQTIDLGVGSRDDSVLHESSVELALYASLRWPICRSVLLDAGLRFSLFAHDRVWYYPEPRVSLEFPITTRARLWASYNMMTQYLHLVPQSNMSFATDFYLTSSSSVPPQLSHNMSLGYASETLDGRLRWSAELYYRYMYNVVEYDSRILTLLYGVSDHYNMIHSGEGESFGLETSVAYADKWCDVQLNYMLSRSLRRFDSINDGRPFPAHSDRRHNLSVLVSCRPSERWTIAATFAYATGAPYTTTQAIYISGNAFVREYGPYNGGKLPDLHHLDLSVTYWLPVRRLSQSGINLSVYNVYARRNPLVVSWNAQLNDGEITINERRHVIYTIIPSVSWTLKF